MAGKGGEMERHLASQAAKKKVAEDDPRFRWYKHGNKMAGVDYAKKNPPPKKYTVSEPFTNELGKRVVSAERGRDPTSAQRKLMDERRHKHGDWTFDPTDRAVVSPGGKRYGKAGRLRGA